MQAHSTRYELCINPPFAAFDIMIGSDRMPWEYVRFQCLMREIAVVPVISVGPAMSIETALMEIGDYGFYGALDKIEGAVWRVERKGVFDFMCKYVRPDKEDGIYLPEISGKEPVWNWQPNNGSK